MLMGCGWNIEYSCVVSMAANIQVHSFFLRVFVRA